MNKQQDYQQYNNVQNAPNQQQNKDSFKSVGQPIVSGGVKNKSN